MTLLDVMQKYDQEVWKGIPEYDNYMISSFGNVKNLKTGRILKPRYNNKGYAQVTLSNNGKTKMFTVHRLVAKAFVPNPENKATVDHIIPDKTNNRASNLQWMSGPDNTRKSTAKKVAQYYRNGSYIATYESAHEASRQTGILLSSIIMCCNNYKGYSHGGNYVWKYV